MVVGRGVERGRVGVAGLDDLGQPGDRGRVGVRVVIEDAVADLDVVAEEVPRLEVADAVPARRPTGAAQRSANEKQSGSDLNSQYRMVDRVP